MADSCGIGFVQEVYATRLAVKRLIPAADVVIELGGEDAKILYLDGTMEVLMNGSCAESFCLLVTGTGYYRNSFRHSGFFCSFCSNLAHRLSWHKSLTQLVFSHANAIINPLTLIIAKMLTIQRHTADRVTDCVNKFPRQHESQIAAYRCVLVNFIVKIRCK